MAARRTGGWIAGGIIAAVVAGGACGGGNDHLILQPPSTSDRGGPASSASGGSSSTAAGSATSVRRPAPVPTTTKGAGTTVGPATTGGPGTTTAAGATTAHRSARGGPGAFARVLLRPAPATRLVVEVMVQGDAGPQTATLDHINRVLREAAGKPVEISSPISIPAGSDTASPDEIRAMADTHGRAAQAGAQAVIRLLFLKGSYGPDAGALGVAVRGDVAAVFSDRVRRAASPFVRRTTIEDAVTMHEIGHLLGLVDLVLQTGRQDPEHPGHSPNRASVMYWAVESDIISQVLDGQPPREFDNADRADLAAIRSGG